MKTLDEHLSTYLLDDPETGSAERRAIEAHLGACGECRRSLESYRRARRLIAPIPSPVPSNDFVDAVFSKVAGGAASAPKRSPWVWSAAGALALVLLAVAYFRFGAPNETPDLLAADDGFYEWAMSPGAPTDDDVLKVVLEDL
jgi:anti-sigma factor RsiW